MARLFSLIAVLVVLLSACVGVSAQDKPEPAKESPKEHPKEPAKEDPKAEETGSDRPTKYPRIRFKDDKIEKVKTADGGTKDVVTKAYLIDLTAAMTGEVKLVDGNTTTRLARVKSKMKDTLDGISKRRDLQFNIASFGNVGDFADKKAPVMVSADAVDRAKKWMDERSASGEGDLYALLKSVFEQEPTSAVLLVGGDMAKPEGIEQKEIDAAGGLRAFVVAALKNWRKDGKKTTLDVVGISLNESQREFYKKLAEAGGGTYLDG